jgi:hypothetical protein
MRLHAAPRGLARSGDAYARAWQMADDGEISGRAYLIADGWQWVGIADDPEKSGAVLLTMGADGARTAERYSAPDDAMADLARYFEDDARATYDAPHPAHFLQFAGCQFVPWLELIADDLGADDAPSSDIPPELEREYLAVLQAADIPPVAAPVAAPVLTLEPLRWMAAATVAPVPTLEPVAVELPEFATIRARFAAMVAPVPTLEPELEPVAVAPVAAARWRRIALKVARAVYGGWWDGAPDLRRPVLISRAELC